MTPERITLIREGVSSWRLAWSRREIDVPAWIGASIDLLDALDAANAELSRLRSSPAQVVGGVPELTKDDLSEACEWTRARGFDGWPELEIEETVANLNKLIAARLPALKPGGVVVDRESLSDLLNGCMVCNADAMAAKNALLSALSHPVAEKEG